MARIVDLGHPAFICEDIDATLDFYAKLGIHESFRLLHDDGSLFLIYLHIAGDRFIEVFPNGPSAAERAGKQSFMHICLAVDDIETFVEDIRARGIMIDVEPENGARFQCAGVDYGSGWQQDRTDAVFAGIAADRDSGREHVSIERDPG